MTTHVLAVDSGSQSTKVSIIDDAGTVLATARAPLRPYVLGPGGRAVHPDDDLWEALRSAVHEVLASFAGRPQELAAVGLCGIRCCRALVDAGGRLTEPVLSWMDDRISRPMEPADPEVALVTSAGGYLTRRLTGERRDSAASYQDGWPIDRRTGGWSTRESDYRRAGVPRELLPDLVEPGDLLGHVTADAADRTGLPAGLPVFATANDKAVEALGSGMIQPGSMLLSLGTYVTAMTVGGDLAPGDGRAWTNDAAVPGQRLCESNGIRRGMWTVSWLADLVTSGTEEDPDQEAALQRLEQEALTLPVGSEELFTIPDWLPPTEAPRRRGALLGLDARHGAAHLYRSALEGIAMTMRGHTEALEAALGQAPTRMLLSGGGSRSELMTQVVADVFGRPVERTAVPDAVGLGAAICAAVGLGTHPDVATAVARMVRPGQVVTHTPAHHARYEQLRAVYRSLGEHTDAVFDLMATVRERQ